MPQVTKFGEFCENFDFKLMKNMSDIFIFRYYRTLLKKVKISFGQH
jgi:hypothetical protein